LNSAVIDIASRKGLFLGEGKPIVSSWISADGHYAFVDFRTAEEADTGFCLKEL
jgi:hypothetical protein